jgi:hypothetical protein
MRQIVKIMAVIIVIVLISNLVLFGMGRISDLLFWLIIILGGISSFLINRFLKR